MCSSLKLSVSVLHNFPTYHKNLECRERQRHLRLRPCRRVKFMHNPFTEQLINTDRNLNRKRRIERKKEGKN